MGYNFRDYNPNQLLLLPPNLDDWLPQEHLARFISNVVDALDLKLFLRRFRDNGQGGAAFHPAMMLPIIIEDLDNNQTLLEKDYLSDLYSELVELDEKVAVYDAKLAAICKQPAECMRLLKVPGIGPLSATAIVAAVGQAKEFKNGREFSAWLGLVPRQNSSGGKTKLQGISKRGDIYLRTLLIHGARAVAYRVSSGKDARSEWLRAVCDRRGMNRAVVARANKTARIVWAVLAKGEDYKEAA